MGVREKKSAWEDYNLDRLAKEGFTEKMIFLEKNLKVVKKDSFGYLGY